MMSGRHILSAATLHYRAFLRLKMLGINICFKGVCDDLFGFVVVCGVLWWFVVFCGGLWCFVVFSVTLFVE